MDKNPKRVAPTLPRKKPIQHDGNGDCFNCGRQYPVCLCGLPVEMSCSQHGEQLTVIALPVYHNLGDGIRAVVGWVNAAQCPMQGCDTLRAIKDGQGVPRNQNTKGGQ